jgi:cysteine desulfurase / selenocysteine lyase
MLPYKVGGGMIKNFIINKMVFLKKNYSSYESGTPNIESCISLGITAEYLKYLSFKKIKIVDKKLLFYFKKYVINFKLLNEMTIFPNITLCSYFSKVPLFSFHIKNLHSHDISSFLNKYGIMCRSGYHCAQPFIELSLNLSSLSRVSATVFNSYNDIYFFTKVVRKLLYTL